MLDQIDGVYLASTVITVGALYLAFAYVRWLDWDDRRRKQRLAHRNLYNMVRR